MNSRVKLTMHMETTTKPHAPVDVLVRPPEYAKMIPKPCVPTMVV